MGQPGRLPHYESPDRLTAQSAYARPAECLFRFSFDEYKRRRIHTITLTGRARAVIKDVAEMRRATAAKHFVAHHAIAGVTIDLDIIFVNRFVKTRPAGAG